METRGLRSAVLAALSSNFMDRVGNPLERFDFNYILLRPFSATEPRAALLRLASTYFGLHYCDDYVSLVIAYILVFENVLSFYLSNTKKKY